MLPIEKFVQEAITFDDILLVPAYSEVLPRQVDVSSYITPQIKLNIPIVSAAMDTVTEHKLAIAIARQGGLGFLHKNMSIDKQAEQVRKVKRSESGLIKDPITLRQDATIQEALRIMRENKIGGIPIVDDKNRLTGILTNRDLRFELDVKMPVSKLMTKNLITAPEGTNLQQAEKILQKHRIEKLPVIDKDGILIGLITYKDILKLYSHPNSCKDEFGRLRVGAAVGVTHDVKERVQALINVGVDVITIDTAHGHSKGVLECISEIKRLFPDLPLVAGNIGTAEGALAVAKAGADGIKVGIGPGSICTTRIVTGVGVPQITAVYNASQAVKDYPVKIIADGGIRYTGDFVKAIAAGADCVMAGSLFAGTEESPGETIIFEGRKFKSYRGMGSLEAMSAGSKDRYFQDVEDDLKKLVPEGIVGRTPFKGSLEEVMNQFIGGLKAGMGYCGAANIESLKKAKFVKMTGAGISESHPHSVAITKEAPNYSR
ncbi:MAG: IMP dehydrogenase [Chitinophagaceae bacterium]|nr:MAG: IMP dehydrogenase [Chitinophagaceae bacterium]